MGNFAPWKSDDSRHSDYWNGRKQSKEQRLESQALWLPRRLLVREQRLESQAPWLPRRLLVRGTTIWLCRTETVFAAL